MKSYWCTNVEDWTDRPLGLGLSNEDVLSTGPFGLNAPVIIQIQFPVDDLPDIAIALGFSPLGNAIGTKAAELG
jgi:hypothetical protein